MKKTAFLTALLLTILIFVSAFSVGATYDLPAGKEPNAESVLLVNLDTDTVMFEKNADKRMFPASTTKIMTCLLALEQCKDLDKTLTANANTFKTLGTGYSNANIKVGETLTIRNLLYTLMLSSACESAIILAEEIGGSIDGFVEMMNNRAKELGLTNTNFVNPHGLHDENQYTTASDLYKLVQKCMEIPEFMEITGTVKHTLPKTGYNPERTITNTNFLLDRNSKYYYNPVQGIKTGYTEEAGRCLVSTATKDGYHYLCIVLGAPTKDQNGNKYADNLSFIDTKTMYEWAFSFFKFKPVVELNEVIANVKVNLSADKDTIHLVPEKALNALIPGDIAASTVEITPSVPSEITAPVKKGDIIGTATVTLYGSEIGKINLVAQESANRSEFLFIMEEIKSVLNSPVFRTIITIILILLAIYVILALFMHRRRKNRAAAFRRRNKAMSGSQRRSSPSKVKRKSKSPPRKRR